MIRVRIVRDWTDSDGTNDRDEWELEVDATYSPDLADDLARRVIAMRVADRADVFRRAREERDGDES